MSMTKNGASSTIFFPSVLNKTNSIICDRPLDDTFLTILAVAEILRSITDLLTSYIIHRC